jgi:hypothetical protein
VLENISKKESLVAAVALPASHFKRLMEKADGPEAESSARFIIRFVGLGAISGIVFALVGVHLLPLLLSGGSGASVYWGGDQLSAPVLGVFAGQVWGDLPVALAGAIAGSLVGGMGSLLKLAVDRVLSRKPKSMKRKGR